MLTIQLLCQIKHENKYFNFARKGYKKYTYGLPRQIRFKVYIHRNLPVNCFFSKPLCCLLLASLLFNLKILCQNSSGNYKPERDYAVPENVIKEYQYQFHNWKDQVEFSNNKAKASFIEILSNHSAELQSMNAAGLLMHGDSLTRSINQIKNNILSHNPSLANKRFELFMERTEEPNACNSGEGIVFFTTGLLVKFTSVDEVAFVISHEIAHDVLNHLRKEMVQTCEAENNSAFKKKLKKTSTIAYGRNTEYEHLWTALFYKEMEDSRRNELQADSLGFIFYKNSGYNIQAATETMSALDAADYDLYPDTLDLKRFFNFKDYPFKSYWMKQDRPKPLWNRDSLLFKIPDSLKTHPDCQVRLSAIKKYSASFSGNVNYKSPPKLVYSEKQKQLFLFENIDALMQNKDFAKALYNSLHMLNAYPNNRYLNCIVVDCLYELADALVHQKYSHYVDFPGQDYSNGYNQMLTFLQNMNSATLKKLGTNYYFQYLSIYSASDPYAAFLKIILDNTDTKSNDISRQIAQFEKDFNEPYFTAILKNKFGSTKKKVQ